MPWKECNRMDERLRFVARLLDGEKIAVGSIPTRPIIKYFKNKWMQKIFFSFQRSLASVSELCQLSLCWLCGVSQCDTK